MSKFNTNTTYPIINNPNEYILYKKTVSIHSEDRDIIKYPNSSYFEIELPQDYLNVYTISLGNYKFPTNYNVFSNIQSNIFISFQIINSTSSYNLINLALHNYSANNFNVYITEGCYTPSQMATELTNRFNEVVNNEIINFITINYTPSDLNDYLLNHQYNDFVIIYNEVTDKLLFGNKSSEFILTNNNPKYAIDMNNICSVTPSVRTYSEWGLPSYLGFTRANAQSIPTNEPPRLYYENNGYWLVPQTNTSTVYVLEAPLKLNITGFSYFYLDISLFNNIDELVPFTATNTKSQDNTNQSNGINNSAFAKIPTNMNNKQNSQYYQNDYAYKMFYPFSERIIKIKIKIRFHNGTLVDFNNINYSFNLIFSNLVPQSLRITNIVDSSTVGSTPPYSPPQPFYSPPTSRYS